MKLTDTVDEKLAQEFLFERTDKSGLKFNGVLIGSVHTDNTELRSEEHSTWVAIYKTVGGALICMCKQENKTTKTSYTQAQVVPMNEITLFFGFTEVAKELYESIGLNDALIEVVP